MLTLGASKTSTDATKPRGPGLGSLPVSAQVYVVAVVAAAVAAVLWSLGHFDLQRPGWFVGLLVLASMSAGLKVPLPLLRSGSSMSPSYAVSFAALLLLGTAPTIIIAVVSAWIQTTFRSRQGNPPHRLLFNMASLALTVLASGAIFERLASDQGTLLSGFLGPVMAATTAYYFLNTLLVAVAVALSTRQSTFGIWQTDFLWSAPSYFLGSLAAAAAVILIERDLYWWTFLVLVPIYLVYRSYATYMNRILAEQRQVREASDLQLAIIEALVLAIEAKDSTSRDEMRRLQVCVDALGRAVGVSDDEMRALRTAALLHDIGNLAVPEHILSKPGPLTHEEFEKVKIHPRVGAEILEPVPFPYAVAPLVMFHHERWDGRGYPTGLAGDAIPLGARLLAVVDNYVALLSDRAHRRAYSPEQALAILRQRAGKVLDPTLVEQFVGVLPSLEPGISSPADWPAQEQGTSDRASCEPRAVALKEIAVAHQEGRTLQTIAQAIGSSLGLTDTMSMISISLGQVMPVSCSALFLRDERSGRFNCAYASGLAKELLATMTVDRLEEVDALGDFVGSRASPDTTPVQSFRSSLVSELIVEGRQFGALVIYHVEPGSYSDDHRRLFRRVSQQVASVIQKAVVFDRTQEASLTDPLTQLPNRRALEHHLAQDLARADRQECEVALLMLDLDEFKGVNDHYGHQTGDRALREVAAVLQSVIRPYDLCARLGGDEFVVALWKCSPEQAAHKRHTIQNAIAQIRFEVESGDEIPLRVSVGAATFPNDGQTTEQLLAAADRQMYRDKAEGKAAGRLHSRIPEAQLVE